MRGDRTSRVIDRERTSDPFTIEIETDVRGVAASLVDPRWRKMTLNRRSSDLLLRQSQRSNSYCFGHSLGQKGQLAATRGRATNQLAGHYVA